MDIKRVWKIYFSPTGTTKRVANAIDEVLSEKLYAETMEYNFTLPKFRESFPELNENDLVIFGMPTYAGRLPNLMLPYLDTIKGNGALAISFVTFGNRNFDNSLIELRNILESKGFHTVAGAALSCEHSFSYDLGTGRPDDEDIAEIKAFAAKVSDKVIALTSVPAPVEVKGDATAGYFKPQDRNGNPINILKVVPKTNDKCDDCGACARNCPMGAISFENPREIVGKCVKCNSCVRRCTKHAKYFDDPGYLLHKSELEYMYGDRRANNEFFL